MKIHEKSALLLATHVGTAGDEYEMLFINGVVPAVKHLGTGRTFELGWHDIINQAISAGINEEPKP